MPYIPQDRRAVLKADHKQAQTPGELNYLFTLEFCRRWKAAPGYATAAEILRGLVFIVADMNQATGPDKWRLTELDAAFQMAFLEFYRMVAAPYEDKKRADNGCVYKEEGVLP